MKVVKGIAALALLVMAGCATALSEHRESYILAQPHGWIEISIADQSIPMLPLEGGGKGGQRPEVCTIRLIRDHEPFLEESVFPSGDTAPFHVASGFRFPIPLGSSMLRINYSGCRVSNGKVTQSNASVEVTVKQDMVTAITFDGINATATAPQEDKAITLERVYRRLEAAVE